MLRILLVGAGGFIGSIARYSLSTLAHRWIHDTFPIGTLLVNVSGCLLAGLFWSFVEYRGAFSTDARLFISVGILGGFTTFSAFGYETFALLHDRQYGFAITNIAANLVLGLAAVVLGWMVGKSLAV